METRIGPDFNNMISNIRKLTPNDLAMTKYALEVWNEKMKSETAYEEIALKTFLNALPIQMQEAMKSINDANKNIENSISEKRKKAGKAGSFGQDELKEAWVDMLKESIQQSNITLDENDLYGVYTKLSYLFKEILNQYTSYEALQRDLIPVDRINEYLSTVYGELYKDGIDHVFKIGKNPDQIAQLAELQRQRDEINADKTLKPAEQNIKIKKDVVPQEKKILEQVKRPYPDNLDKMSKEVNESLKSLALFDKALVGEFVSKVKNENLIPILGERKTLFNKISQSLQSDEFDRLQTYKLIQELNAVAIERKEPQLAYLCGEVIKKLEEIIPKPRESNIAIEKASKIHPSPVTIFRRELPNVQQQQNAPSVQEDKKNPLVRTGIMKKIVKTQH